MVFISYAQNFEDVMLWRAFKDLATGFYIDVGAAHPDVDSVTRAFYDRGWSGINIEPSSGFFPRLAATRMRDVNLNVTLGAESGTSTFYRVSGSGLSTSAPDVAAANRQAGWESEESLVECMTLADVCRRHAPADIHFLKIDVEGSERAVLAGADFDSFRPWVVLVEATRPMSREPNHQDWEPILVNAGYRSVWFDGLNRFYIAKEREPALRECFILPPNVFDDFLRTVDTEATHKIAECQAELQQSQAQVEALRAQVQERVAWEQNLLASMASAKETWRAEATMLQGDIAHARKARDHAEARTAALLNSTSWRITAPMRAIARLRHRPAPPVGDAAEQAEPPHMPVLPPSETTAIASRNGPPDALPPPSPPVGEKGMGISGRGRIWIDVEDLFEYARGNPRPSGIQRLAYEIYRELHERHGSNGFIYFVRNASGAHDFYVVQWSEIAALFAGLTAGSAEPRTAPLPVGIPPHSPTRQAIRKLVYRLPSPLRGAVTDVRITQSRALHAWGKLVKALLREARRRPSSHADRSGFVPAEPDAAGPETVLPADEFARLAGPGDTLLALGSPWSHPAYAEVVRRQRAKGMRFGLLVYDLIPLRRPEWCDRSLVRLFRAWYDSVFPLCDDLFAISRASALDVESYARERGIALPGPVVPIPIGTGFGKAGQEAGRLPGRRLPQPGSYALIVSTIEARKNHLLLFRVWRRMLEEMPPERVPTLVFAGRIGWLVEDLMHQIANTSNLDGKLVIIEDPSDADLVALYQGCLFTLFPSFFEGWGLPVTESLALGKPCFISNRTSLPESGGKLARAFDPDNLHEAYAMIRAVIDDRDDLARWEAQVRREFKPVPWSASADAILARLGHSLADADPQEAA